MQLAIPCHLQCPRLGFSQKQAISGVKFAYARGGKTCCIEAFAHVKHRRKMRLFEDRSGAIAAQAACLQVAKAKFQERDRGATVCENKDIVGSRCPKNGDLKFRSWRQGLAGQLVPPTGLGRRMGWPSLLRQRGEQDASALSGLYRKIIVHPIAS